MDTDVGRTFLFTRVFELIVELDDGDVAAQGPNETAKETAEDIVRDIPIGDWSLVGGDCEEIS